LYETEALIERVDLIFLLNRLSSAGNELASKRIAEQVSSMDRIFFMKNPG
jgi:hypothetical protein